MASTTPPTDQRARARPISFVLNDIGSMRDVTLKIRPEDLTRNEPSRVSVHQTLGRQVTGWSDEFGEGLPSCTISGHTGWRIAQGTGRDGAKEFEALNQLVVHDYHSAKQRAIDSGIDPAVVKLLFIDTLDDFAWEVVPTQFVLRRSRSRPLLFQYNISLQAKSTAIDNPLVNLPFFGGVAAGLGSLGGAISRLQGFVNNIQQLVSTAVGFVDAGLAPVAATVRQFADMSTRVFVAARDAAGSIAGGASSIANSTIGIASDLARVGVNVFRTISAISNLPSSLKAELGRIASAYNEVYCIFRNSLKPAEVYEEYTGLYGASNCSSTSGGRAPSIYADRNAFSLMRADQAAIGTSSGALSSISSLGRSDPVLAPMPVIEMNRHLIAVVNGVAA